MLTKICTIIAHAVDELADAEVAGLRKRDFVCLQVALERDVEREHSLLLVG